LQGFLQKTAIFVRLRNDVRKYQKHRKMAKSGLNTANFEFNAVIDKLPTWSDTGSSVRCRDTDLAGPGLQFQNLIF